ncbi:histone-lysine N-methyltransferase ASHR2-like [Rhodamnia argentea]|uniref:Histone-lysine N-methyltransferase ASHR2-like n=1 Tax=Rhodamnia argentea TaxID=178133 RepID=A0ABM3HTF6_9MYRT|nr:histone-lysine N-methyltransferase ASHR2-like [Rhodamnia argentea]
MADKAASLLNLAEIEGRGRALAAAQPLRGGQIALWDSSILLCSALPTTCYCANCFKILPQSSSSQAVSCPTCDRHAFCSPSCLCAALTTSHPPWVCQALSRLVACPLLDGQPLERHVQARFLIAACNLATVSPSYFQLLLSLQGREAHTDDTIAAAQFLHSLLASVCPPPPPASPFPQGFSFEMIVALLSRDKLNAFCLMEPVSSRDGDELDGEISIIHDEGKNLSL